MKCDSCGMLGVKTLCWDGIYQCDSCWNSDKNDYFFRCEDCRKRAYAKRGQCKEFLLPHKICNDCYKKWENPRFLRQNKKGIRDGNCDSCKRKRVYTLGLIGTYQCDKCWNTDTYDHLFTCQECDERFDVKHGRCENFVLRHKTCNECYKKWKMSPKRKTDRQPEQPSGYCDSCDKTRVYTLYWDGIHQCDDCINSEINDYFFLCRDCGKRGHAKQGKCANFVVEHMRCNRCFKKWNQASDSDDDSDDNSDDNSDSDEEDRMFGFCARCQGLDFLENLGWESNLCLDCYRNLSLKEMVYYQFKEQFDENDYFKSVLIKLQTDR